MSTGWAPPTSKTPAKKNSGLYHLSLDSAAAIARQWDDGENDLRQWARQLAAYLLDCKSRLADWENAQTEPPSVPSPDDEGFQADPDDPCCSTSTTYPSAWSGTKKGGTGGARRMFARCWGMPILGMQSKNIANQIELLKLKSPPSLHVT